MNQMQIVCEANKSNFSFFLGRFYQLFQSYLEIKNEKFSYKRKFFSDSFQTILIEKPKVSDADFFIGKYSMEMADIYSGLKKIWEQIQEDMIPSSDIKLQLNELSLDTKIMFYSKKFEDLVIKASF